MALDNAQDFALFAGNNNSVFTAQMANGGAANQNDWGTVLANGINGAVYNAIQAKINGAYADGQLQVANTGANAGIGGMSTMNILILAALAFVLLGDK
ncbi:hypothetical protein [Undibacterium sp.]|uniref:hypothetical protein n=1 Tax=Undibacterium sp. TaxID=1914977 RepID=UPI00272F8E06|nr:hypothetical protein [Undibacterium sp.]MDP1978041.1 hypothetical protein [Undibacterium sp.]